MVSRKNPSCDPYYVTHIYNTAHQIIYDTIVPGDDLKTRSYIRHFINATSCRRFFNINDMTPLAEGVDPVEIDAKINKIKDKIIESNKKEEVQALLGNDIHFIKAVSEDVLAEAKNLVKLFNKERATDYYTWYQVGKCLHNIDQQIQYA